MILYHLSKDLSEKGLFEPRIPSTALTGEEAIPRICLSSSIEGCLSAINYGGAHLEMYNSHAESLYKVFVIDTDKYNIQTSSILTPQEVYQKGVYDALETNEYWLLEPIQVFEEDVFIMELLDWREESKIAIPYEVAELQKQGFCKGNIVKIWDYIAEETGRYGVDEEPPFLTIIHNIVYRKHDYQFCKDYIDDPTKLYKLLQAGNQKELLQIV